MPLFKKKQKSTEDAVKPKAVVKEKTKKQKTHKRGGFFSRKPKKTAFDPNQSIISQLKLEPAVPEVIAERLLDYSQFSENPLVKQNGTAYDVLVVPVSELTEAFDNLDDDATEDALGELSGNLHNDVINNATTEEDLIAQQLVIIPTEETLSELTESPVMSMTTYHLGHFPVDGDLQDAPVPYDDELITLGELIKKQEEAIDDNALPDDEDTDDIDLDSPAKTVDDDTTEEDESFLDDDADDDLFGDDDDDLDMGDDTSEDDDDDLRDIFADDEEDDDLFGDDETDDTDSDMVADLDAEEDSVEPQAETVARAQDKVITGSDLTLVADVSRFNETFIDQPVQLFELTNDNDSELQKTLNGMKLSANTKLKAARAQSLQRLTQLFQSSISTMANYVQNKYSYTNPESEYSRAKAAIAKIRDDSRDALEPRVEEAQASAQSRYKSSRDIALAPQIALLQQQYDLDHAAELKASIAQAEFDIVSKVEDSYKSQLVALDARRQDESQQSFAKVINNLIQQLQEQYSKDLQKEDVIYNNAQAELDKFQQDNFIIESKRAQAVQEQNRDESKAEKTRREMQAMIDELQAKLENTLSSNGSTIEDLNRKLEQARLDKESAVADVRKDYQKQLEVMSNANEVLSKSNGQLLTAASHGGKSGFRNRPSEGASEKEKTSDEKSVIVPQKKKSINKATVAGVVGAGIIIVGGGLMYSQSAGQNAKLHSEVSSLAGNYSDLHKKYVQLSGDNQKTSDALAQAKKDAQKKLLTNDNSFEAKSTKSGSSDTIRVAKSDNYGTGQTVVASSGDNDVLAKVTKVDNDKHTVTVHVDSLNQDFLIQR